eukprot:gene10177-13693_t
MKNLALYLIPAIIFISIQFFIERKEFTVHKSGIILITGSSTGIGYHAALHLANKYPNFKIIAGVRKQSDIKHFEDLKMKNLIGIQLDVTDHKSCVRAIKDIETISEQNKLQLIGVVNNAGLGSSVPVEVHKMEDIRALFDVNYFGVVDLVQLSLPFLRASRGRIINISSVSGFVSTPLSGVYSSSKFALESLSDALRQELAQFGISVSVIQPAYVKSAIHAKDEKNAGKIKLLQDMKSDKISPQSPEKLYEKFLGEKARLKQKADVDGASDPFVTSVAIEDALVSKYPSTRYRVATAAGMPAWFISWLTWALTDRMGDFTVENL